jgi:hypothetical protein
MILGCALVAASPLAEQKSGKAKGDEKTKQETSKKKKSEATAAAEKEKEKEEKRLPFPLPVGHGGKGLAIPYLDGSARKTMNFVIGTAERRDADTVEMGELKIETFNEEGGSEMIIDLPISKLDLTTRVISTDKSVHIHCDEFDLTGERMIFNTTTKRGTLEGRVRMIIFNQDNEPEPDPAAKPKEEPKPGE